MDMRGYQNYKEQAINTMTQGELLLVLYDELVKRAKRAELALEKEEYTLFENTDFSAQTSREQYAALVWSANKLEGQVPVQEDEDLTWFEYSRTANGTDYTYRAYVYKCNEAFWLIQFAARSEAFPALGDTIHGYAASVYFDQPYLSTLPEIQY